MTNSTFIKNINHAENKAWVTFMHDNWEQNWYAVTDYSGHHLDWDSNDIMWICRQRFGNVGIQFGIANTEQMLMGNAMRDNL